MPKEYAYTVRGHWPFPPDMLRQDGSRAATPADQNMIGRLTRGFSPDPDVFLDVDIKLVGPRKPNTARWESFGWSVPRDIEHRMFKEVRTEERRRQDLMASAMAKLTAEEREVVESQMTPSG